MKCILKMDNGQLLDVAVTNFSLSFNPYDMPMGTIEFNAIRTIKPESPEFYNNAEYLELLGVMECK